MNAGSPTRTVPFADLSRQAANERVEFQAAFDEVLSKGRFILGEAVEAFESAFATAMGARFGVGCANGTDAITLALMALGIGPGDEVLTVSMTCAPTATGIARAGASPVLVDVDDARLTMDPECLANAVSSRTRAIVPVHLYGRPANMPEISAFAARHGLAVVEDAAQAHGARLHGKRVGTFANTLATAWSFYPTKNLGALGDGGLVTTSDERVQERLRRLRVYGYETRDDAQEPGLNSRLDELQAALLLVRLKNLEAANRRRRELAERYDQALAGLPGLKLPKNDANAVDAQHLYVVRLKQRDRVRKRLLELGIGTAIHYPRAVHQQPAFANCRRGPLEVTERAVTEILSLPLYPELTDEEAAFVIEGLRKAMREQEPEADFG